MKCLCSCFKIIIFIYVILATHFLIIFQIYVTRSYASASKIIHLFEIYTPSFSARVRLPEALSPSFATGRAAIWRGHCADCGRVETARPELSASACRLRMAR